MNRLHWASAQEMIETLTTESEALPAPSADAQLSIDGLEDADLGVVAYRGEERMNELYRIHVLFWAAIVEETLRPIALGKACHLALALPDGSRRMLHGTAGSAALHAARGDRGLYHVEIVPKAWLMTQTANSRVYQRATVREILGDLLNANGVPHVLSLARRYEERRYCLQYRETAFEFMTRLLEEEGLFYSFVHPATADELRELMLTSLPGDALNEVVGIARGGSIDGGDLLARGQRLLQPSAIMAMAEQSSLAEVLVISDTPAAYAPVPGASTLVYRPDVDEGAMAVPEAHIPRFGLRGSIKPTRSTVRDYDPERAGRPPAGTVIGTVEQGFRGALADGTSALVGAGSEAIGGLGGAAGPALASGLGAVSGAAGVSVTEPLEQAAQANESIAFGVLTATHAILPLEAGLERTGVAAATALAQAIIPDAGWDGIIGSVGGAAQNMIGGTEVSLEMYEHHGEYEEPEASFASARSKLEQWRSRYIECSGHTHNRRLTAGKSFTLEDHAMAILNRAYAITAVTHEGFGSATDGRALYRNEIECVPVEVPFRPERSQPRLCQVVETAVVVAASEQEIATNEAGSVKIQFHWDREGKHDDKSSCFVRVMQAWAGGHYGVQFIPRVGMEVLVSFIGGDINRPVITGCMPNLANAPPYELPEHRTRSVIRTRSTPNAEGYNELMFEDRVGQEQIFVRAERDLREEVRHDQTTHVLHDLSVAVDNDERHTVGGRSHTSIRGERHLSVDGRSRETVQGSRETTTDGNDTTRVAGARHVAVGGNATTSVERSASTSVDGSHTLRVGQRYQISVGGEDGGSMSTHVQGAHATTSSSFITLTAEGAIMLQCGDSSVMMNPGNIILNAPKVQIIASEEVELASGQGARLRLTDRAEISADAITLVSRGALVKLDDNATMDGGKVRLLSGDANVPNVESSSDDAATQPLDMAIVDADGGARASCRYHAVVGDQEFRGTTDANGRIGLRVPQGATNGSLTVWSGDYPTGPSVTRALAIGPIGDASSVEGARTRLANLGYAPGPPPPEGADDAMGETMRDSLRAFQQARGLGDTGELNMETVAALRDLHRS